MTSAIELFSPFGSFIKAELGASIFKIIGPLDSFGNPRSMVLNEVFEFTLEFNDPSNEFTCVWISDDSATNTILNLPHVGKSFVLVTPSNNTIGSLNLSVTCSKQSVIFQDTIFQELFIEVSKNIPPAQCLLLLHFDGSGIITPQNVASKIIDSSPNNRIPILKQAPGFEFNPLFDLSFVQGFFSTAVRMLPTLNQNSMALVYSNQPDMTLDNSGTWEINYIYLAVPNVPSSLGAGSFNLGGLAFQLGHDPFNNQNLSLALRYKDSATTFAFLSTTVPIPASTTFFIRYSLSGGVARIYFQGVRVLEEVLPAVTQPPSIDTVIFFSSNVNFDTTFAFEELSVQKGGVVTTAASYEIPTTPTTCV